MALVAKHCCEAMAREVNWQCDTHASRNACSDDIPAEFQDDRWLHSQA
jgi:hypothetical protein